MCTAYELGKWGSSFPKRVKAKGAEILLGLKEVPWIIRPRV